MKNDGQPTINLDIVHNLGLSLGSKLNSSLIISQIRHLIVFANSLKIRPRGPHRQRREKQISTPSGEGTHCRPGCAPLRKNLTHRCKSQIEWGRVCYQLICTIVGLAEEPPFDKHDKCLCSSVSDDPSLCLANFGQSVFVLNNYDHGPTGFVIKCASRVF